MIDTSKRDSEICLRHFQHNNSIKALSRFYGLPQDEIRFILTRPTVAVTRCDHPSKATPNAFLQSVEALLMWVCENNGIRKEELRSNTSEDSRNASRMMAYNLRNRWGLDWLAISKVVGYQQAALARMVKACADRQMPPCSPPDPKMPKLYMRALRKIADRYDMTPHAVLHGSALVHQRARLAYFGHMVDVHKASAGELANVTGYGTSRTRHIMRKLKVFA